MTTATVHKRPPNHEGIGQHGLRRPRPADTPWERMCKALELSTEVPLDRVLDEAVTEIAALRAVPDNEELAAMRTRMIADQRRLQQAEKDMAAMTAPSKSKKG